jgi:hypothetical protein
MISEVCLRIELPFGLRMNDERILLKSIANSPDCAQKLLKPCPIRTVSWAEAAES